MKGGQVFPTLVRVGLITVKRSRQVATEHQFYKLFGQR